MKILVFRIGSLGDNLVAIPAIQAIKENYPKTRLYLLGNKLFASPRVLGQEIFEGSGLFTGYFQYPVIAGWIGRLIRPFRMFLLLLRLRIEKFDALVYLAPTERQKKQVQRDRRFFRMAGISWMIGVDSFKQLGPHAQNSPIPKIPFEADWFLNRLEASGLKTRPPNSGAMELHFNNFERRKLQHIVSDLPSDGGRLWIGIGPGSNQPAKIWPKERFERVVLELIQKHDVWPTVFGGREDQNLGEELIRFWGRGYNFAGLLPVRLSGLALEKCQLYLGNDTGAMHLAALMKVPCVAVFCSHSYPGQWFPYGSGHKVFYQQIECAGCGLVECIERKMECILSIQTDEVLDACRQVLEKSHNT